MCPVLKLVSLNVLTASMLWSPTPLQYSFLGVIFAVPSVFQSAQMCFSALWFCSIALQQCVRIYTTNVQISHAGMHCHALQFYYSLS